VCARKHRHDSISLCCSSFSVVSVLSHGVYKYRCQAHLFLCDVVGSPRSSVGSDERKIGRGSLLFHANGTCAFSSVVVVALRQDVICAFVLTAAFSASELGISTFPPLLYTHTQTRCSTFSAPTFPLHTATATTFGNTHQHNLLSSSTFVLRERGCYTTLTLVLLYQDHHPNQLHTQTKSADTTLLGLSQLIRRQHKRDSRNS
jgi:hypothetical protein